jgi:hypothetical protein
MCELRASDLIFKGQWTTDTVYKHCATKAEMKQLHRLESPKTLHHVCMYVCLAVHQSNKVMFKIPILKDFGAF